MAVRVYVTDSALQDEAFVLSGRLVSGDIRAGMEVVVAVNSMLDLVTVIDEVQRGSGPEVRLVVRNAEAAEMLAWLDVREEEVEVRPGG